jgi:YbbR domain-containing protein
MLDRLLVRWPLKLLAFLLAFGIWLSVTGQKRVPRDFRAPLDVTLGEEMVVADLSHSTVTVRLRGAESQMERLQSTDLTVQLDLTGADLGEREALLTPDRVTGVPNGVEIVWIDPDRVGLTVDRRARRMVRLAPRLLGEPPEGYTLYGARMMPERIEIEGPEQEVAGIEKIETEPVRLDERTSSFTAVVAAVPTFPDIRVLSPQRPEVRVEIDTDPTEAVYDDVPIQLSNARYESEITPSAVRVTVMAPASLLARLGPANLRVVAEAGALEPRQRSYKVRLEVQIVDVAARDRMRISVDSTRPADVGIRVSDRELTE